MISFILEAAENFCTHQLRVPYVIQPLPSQMRILFAYLDVTDAMGGGYRVYMGCDNILIQTVAEIFLDEKVSDTQTLNDMLLETTNMIIGSAKVLAQEKPNASFTISTPHIQKEFPLNLDNYYTFGIGEGNMMIAIKAL